MMSKPLVIFVCMESQYLTESFFSICKKQMSLVIALFRKKLNQLLFFKFECLSRISTENYVIFIEDKKRFNFTFKFNLFNGFGINKYKLVLSIKLFINKIY